MNDPRESVRPVPRWLHLWAIAAVLVTLVLLVLGQFVTSFRAGMADPIWPTEPWYLFVVGWQEPNRGYLIEHSHRIAGFVVGALMSVLALGLWWTEPIRFLRRFGVLLIIALLAAYGQLHGELIAQRDPSKEVHIPLVPVVVMAAAMLSLLGLAMSGSRGTGLRLLGVVALIAVMIQGLLGGFRVRLDALFGPELAPVHGIFAQVVFCLLVSLAVLTRRRASIEVADEIRTHLGRFSLGLVAVLFVQLILGAMIRHRPDPLNQRFHFLTAFLAVVVAVRLIRAIEHYARPNLRFATRVLGALLLIQLLLGVEAWMGKFGEEARAGKIAAAYLAEAEPVSAKHAAIRTAHTLVGTGLLAVAVVLALRVRARKSIQTNAFVRPR